MHRLGLLLILLLTFFIKIHAQQNLDSLIKLRQDAYVIYDSARNFPGDSSRNLLIKAFRAGEDLISVDNYLVNYQLKKQLAIIDSMKIESQSLQADYKKAQKENQYFKRIYLLLIPAGIGLAALVVILGLIVLRRKYYSMVLRKERAEHEAVIAQYRLKISELRAELDHAMDKSKEYHEVLSRHRIDTITTKEQKDKS